MHIGVYDMMLGIVVALVPVLTLVITTVMARKVVAEIKEVKPLLAQAVDVLPAVIAVAEVLPVTLSEIASANIAVKLAALKLDYDAKVRQAQLGNIIDAVDEVKKLVQKEGT